MQKRQQSANPKYESPPVVETVLGVQFSELPGFRAAHFGLYWEMIRDRFPKVPEDHQRLRQVSERFPVVSGLQETQLTFSNVAIPNRVWFTAEDKSQIIQVQPNWFLYNWRGGQYPSYRENNHTFLEELEKFRQFCHSEDLGELQPNLCEVTYVNRIAPNETESAITLFGNMFTGLKWKSSTGFLGEPEQTAFNRVWTIGENAGRLYAEASLALNSESKRDEVHLRMTGRVNHISGEMTTIADSIQLAHDWVVQGFASITESEIQKDRWGLK